MRCFAPIIVKFSQTPLVVDDDNNILYKCTLHVLHESIKLNYQVHVGNLSKKMQEYKERSIQDLFLSLTSCLNRQMGRYK